MTPDFLQAPVIQMPFGKESKAAKKKWGVGIQTFARSTLLGIIKTVWGSAHAKAV